MHTQYLQCLSGFYLLISAMKVCIYWLSVSGTLHLLESFSYAYTGNKNAGGMNNFRNSYEQNQGVKKR